MQVDHKEGHVSLRDWDDLPNFILHLVGSEERFADFQLVEKEAHKIKSYAERMGISFEEAMLEKEVIAFKKLKANVQKEILINECSFNPDGLNLNKALDRAEAYRRHLMQEAKDADGSTETNPNSR